MDSQRACCRCARAGENEGGAEGEVEREDSLPHSPQRRLCVRVGRERSASASTTRRAFREPACPTHLGLGVVDAGRRTLLVLVLVGRLPPALRLLGVLLEKVEPASTMSTSVSLLSLQIKRWAERVRRAREEGRAAPTHACPRPALLVPLSALLTRVSEKPIEMSVSRSDMVELVASGG